MLSRISLFFTALAALIIGSAHAAAMIPAPPTVAATGYVLVDMHSDKILAADKADQRMEPASITKIMTAHIVFSELEAGHIKLTDQVLISERAWKMPGSRMFVEVNTRVSVEDLLRGMIIQSGNDASVALAEHIAGSEEAFANLMNEHAQRLGMHHTHFVNATGMPDPEHYTTPIDIAHLTASTIREFPQWYKLYAEKDFTYNKIHQPNRNNLLWKDKSVDGVKTGHTESAGYCLVASAERDGMRLIAVVMGTQSMKARERESLSLLNYGFRFFETHRLYAGGAKLIDARVWKGEQEALPLGLVSDLYVTIPRLQYDKLKASTQIQGRITAPVSKGDVAGEVIVELDGDKVASAPLIALQNVAEGSLWRRALDSARLWWE